MGKLKKPRNNVWIPKKKVGRSILDKYVPLGKNFLVATKDKCIGIGFYNGKDIIFSILSPEYGDKNVCTLVPFSEECPYPDPAYLYFFTRFRKDSRYWIDAKNTLPPEKFLVLGYNKDWKDSESEYNGIRLGYLYEKSGKKMFHSIAYDNEEDKYLDFREEGDDYNDLIYDPGGKHPEYRPNMPEYWRFVQG